VSQVTLARADSDPLQAKLPIRPEEAGSVQIQYARWFRRARQRTPCDSGAVL